MFFRKKAVKTYDSELKTPVLRCSICTGEMVAGFRDNKSGEFSEDSLISNDNDLNEFKRKYNITGQIEKIY